MRYVSHTERGFTRQHKTNYRGGFTLAELLVVISIIGILSSVLLANLSVARSKARDAVRMQEMRSIATALEAYHARNGQYPVVPDAGTQDNNWFDIESCHSNYHNFSTSDLFPTFLQTITRDPISQGANFCHWYAGPDYLGYDGYVLYYQFEDAVDLPRDCGDTNWGGNWYCLGQ